MNSSETPENHILFSETSYVLKYNNFVFINSGTGS